MEQGWIQVCGIIPAGQLPDAVGTGAAVVACIGRLRQHVVSGGQADDMPEDGAQYPAMSDHQQSFAGEFRGQGVQAFRDPFFHHRATFSSGHFDILMAVEEGIHDLRIFQLQILPTASFEDAQIPFSEAGIWDDGAADAVNQDLCSIERSFEVTADDSVKSGMTFQPPG